MSELDTTSKDEFIKVFGESDWLFYCEYPRLYATYSAFKDFTLEDLRTWHSKFNCSADQFSLIIKPLHMRVCFEKFNPDFSNDYENLAKYNFKYFMDNIEELVYREHMPIRIRQSIIEYLRG